MSPKEAGCADGEMPLSVLAEIAKLNPNFKEMGQIEANIFNGLRSTDLLFVLKLKRIPRRSRKYGLSVLALAVR